MYCSNIWKYQYPAATWSNVLGVEKRKIMKLGYETLVVKYIVVTGVINLSPRFSHANFSSFNHLLNRNRPTATPEAVPCLRRFSYAISQ